MAGVREITISGVKRRLLNRYGDSINMDDVGGNQVNQEQCKVSRCIAALAINVFNPDLANEICSDAVCDGRDDNCIDAIYVNHDKKIVTVVQAKFDQSGNSSIGRQEIADYLTACKSILMEEYDIFNQRFNRFSSDLEKAYDESYKYAFVYAYSGRDDISDDVNRIISDRKEEFNFDLDGDFIDIHPLSLSAMKDYLSRRALGTIDLGDVEVLQYGITEEPLKAVHGIITGDQIATWWESYGDLLLEDNIRGGLGDSSEVNRGIKETLLNNPDMFYYYNNGITILVNSFTPRRRNNQARRESGGFDFTNMNIINGAQTISTIGKTFLSGEMTMEQLSTIKVPCRFIKVENYGDEEGNKIALEITIANNSQNKVTARDFISKDPFQIELKKSFSFEEPYIYEIKRSESESDDDIYLITVEDALSSLVCNLVAPRYISLLKSSRGRFFESINSPTYKAVFNPSVHCVLLINVVNIYRSVCASLNAMESNRETKRDQKIIIHGRYVFASLIMHKYNNLITRSTVVLHEQIPSFVHDLESYFTDIKDYIDEFYSTSHMPRFFENQTRVKELFDLFIH
ncbi:AIPR family protein [Pectobacterium sp. B2J-2]|uniref:AIPR family protein n=1 Tax=Pectobacterium sp. B2J-2 TaxID=3385372 RepID=UPI0038FBEAC7